MGRANGALFSLEARGSIAKTLNYQKRKEGQKIRAYSKPNNIPSQKQRARRRLMEFIVAHWKGLSDADKAIWQNSAQAKILGITGYQYFLKQCQADPLGEHGLKAYFPFNELLNGKLYSLVEESGYFTPSNTGAGANPSLTQSFQKKFGKMLSFDGVGGILPSTDVTMLNVGTGNFFIEIWTKLNSLSGDGYLLECYNSGSSTGFIIVAHTDSLQVYVNDGSNNASVTSDVQIDDGEVHCIQIVGDRSDKLYVYIDLVSQGTPAGLTALTDPINPSETTNISKVGNLLDGYVDELAVYNRMPTTEELSRRYWYGLNTVRK